MSTEAQLTRDIARRVRATREGVEPRLTQEDVGARLGLSKVGYGHYERGSQPFSVWHLFELATILGRPVEYFLGLSTDLRPDEQVLLGGYRRLDDSPHQARVLVTLLDLCQLWSDAPAPAPDAGVAPLLVAQRQPDGEFRVIHGGLMETNAPLDPADLLPVNGQPLSEDEVLLVGLLREMNPAEREAFVQEMRGRVSSAPG